jgi:hypothetical protein
VEAFDQLGVAQTFVQGLDRDFAPDQHVLGQVHVAHAALADAPQHAVATVQDAPEQRVTQCHGAIGRLIHM